MAPKKRTQQLAKLADRLRDAEPVEPMPPPQAPPIKRQRVKKPVEPAVEPAVEPVETPEDPAVKKPRKSRKKTDSTEPRDQEPEEPAPKAKAKPTAKAKSQAKSEGLASPDFKVCWENHSKLMSFYNLTEEEATECLLSVVGEDEAGRSFWEKFRTSKDATVEQPHGPPVFRSREEQELLTDSQLPEYEHVDTDLESSGSIGSFLDQLETQPMETDVKTSMPTVTGERPQPSPARAPEVWCF